MADRNIAFLARNGGFSHLIGYVDEKAIAVIPKLYHSVRTIETKKGTWRVYERGSLPHFSEEEQKHSDGFCAVYERKGRPRTLFLGRLEDAVHVNSTVNELSDNVLEQRRFFAWPPRKLTAGDGSMYGIQLGGSFYLIALGALVVDFGVSLYGKLSGSFEHESLIERFNKYSGVSDKDKPLFITLASVGFMGTFIGIIYGFGYAGGKLGKVSDKIRIKNLPKKAFSFLYGREAEEAVLQEHPIAQEELRKIRLYEELRENGVIISKPYFLYLDELMQTSEIDRVAALLNHLAQNPRELNVPLDKLVAVFSRK